MNWKYYGFALCAAFSSSAALAQDREKSAVELFAAALKGNDVLQTKSGRDALVEKLGAYCSAIKNVAPTNSPTDDQWLEAEMAAGFERLTRAAESAEFARRRTSLFTAGCLNGVYGYKQGFETDALTYLTYEFTRFDQDAEYLAKQTGFDGVRYSLGALSVVTQSLAYAAWQSAGGGRVKQGG